MKIDIGPYSSGITWIRSWEKRYELWRSESYYHDENDWNRVDRLVYNAFEGLYALTSPFDRWSNKRKRRVKVHIDNYDVWNADHTLALVIHPTLVKLREQKQGAPHVDPEDVPEHLRPSDEANEHNGYVDNTHFDRWNWVLDEMIWAFEQCAKDDRGDSQFHHNTDQLHTTFDKVVEFNYQKDPAKPKYWVDREAEKLHYDRISNGLRLFAKYYFNLWD